MCLPKQVSRWGFVFTLALLAAGCGSMDRDDSPTSSGGSGTPPAIRTTIVGSKISTSPGNVLSTATLQLQVLTNSCGANQAQDFFEVTNTGSSPIKLSDISIKFWVDDTTGQSIVPHVWTGGCVTGVNGNPSCVHQVSGVTPSAASFSPACGPDPTNQANWEISITNSDTTTLAPGATWSNIQAALNLENYSNFNPGTADWYSPCLSGSAYTADPHFAVYFQGNLVFLNGVNAPSCRAPQGSQALAGYVNPNGTFLTRG
jgi:hypothetical protein